MENAERIDVAWWCAVDQVGAVLIYDKYMGFKCYIGEATGIDEDIDSAHIQNQGVKLPMQVAYAIFPDRMKYEIEKRHPGKPEGFMRYDGQDYIVSVEVKKA